MGAKVTETESTSPTQPPDSQSTCLPSLSLSLPPYSKQKNKRENLHAIATHHTHRHTTPTQLSPPLSLSLFVLFFVFLSLPMITTFCQLPLRTLPLPPSLSLSQVIIIDERYSFLFLKNKDTEMK